MSDTVAGMIAQFGKDYKDTDIARVGISDTLVPRLPTGYFPLDLAIGGGFPEGRCSVIYGPESSMKSTLALKLIASAQKKHPDKRAVFIDIEGHFDSDWAQKMGVNTDELAYIIPPTAEQFVDMAESLLYAEDVSVIVCDSLAALTTTHELDSSAEKAMVGNAGILINKFYRKVSRALSKAKAQGIYPTLICINQIRHKVGVMYGSPETQPGGLSFKFASSLTLRVAGKDEEDKDAPNPNIPAFKKISASVYKQKIGITNKNAELHVALQPMAKLKLAIGEAKSWNTVVAYLKDLGFFDKPNKTWDLTLTDTGEIISYKTQDELREQMQNDHEFDARVKTQIFQAVLNPEKMIYG